MDLNTAKKLIERSLGKYGRMDQVNLHALSADVQELLDVFRRNDFYIHADKEPTTIFMGLKVLGDESVTFMWHYGAEYYMKMRKKIKMYNESGFDYIGGKL